MHQSSHDALHIVVITNLRLQKHHNNYEAARIESAIAMFQMQKLIQLIRADNIGNSYLQSFW
jgi:vancomycin permeability regulator SanA